jgi:hypothetical protein
MSAALTAALTGVDLVGKRGCYSVEWKALTTEYLWAAILVAGSVDLKVEWMAWTTEWWESSSAEPMVDLSAAS